MNFAGCLLDNAYAVFAAAVIGTLTLHISHEAQVFTVMQERTSPYVHPVGQREGVDTVKLGAEEIAEGKRGIWLRLGGSRRGRSDEAKR